MSNHTQPILDWYFDIISPFAFLHFQQLSKLQAEGKLRFRPVPVLLGVIFNQTGNIGPAEIPSKRKFAYRFIRFQAAQLGYPIRFPSTHPFNPLPALRLICAAAEAQSMAMIKAVLDGVWVEGQALDSIERLAPIAHSFGIDCAAALSDDAVKQRLKTNTEQAIARGVFGVPTLLMACQHGDELFFGSDATEYCLAALNDPSILLDAEAQRLLSLPSSIERKRG